MTTPPAERQGEFLCLPGQRREDEQAARPARGQRRRSERVHDFYIIKICAAISTFYSNLQFPAKTLDFKQALIYTCFIMVLYKNSDILVF